MKFNWKKMALLWFLLPWNVQGISFKIQDLGTLSNSKAVAYDLNNNNKVVGHFVDYDGERYNFTWDSENQLIPLRHKSCSYQPLFINNRDQIATVFWHKTNYWLFENQQMKHLGLIEKNESLTDLGAPTQWKMQVLSDWQTASAWQKDDLGIIDFNDCGQWVVANSSNIAKASQFAIYEKGKFELLDPKLFSVVYAINNQGFLLARQWIKNEKENYPALVLYNRKDKSVQIIAKDIDLEGRRLNDRGQVTFVLSSHEDQKEALKGFFWDPEKGLTVWDDFVPVAMNHCDQVIGYQFCKEKGPTPMLCNKGEWINLQDALMNQQDLLWRKIQVKQINDQGYILGFGSFDGKEHPFILIPQPDLP